MGGRRQHRGVVGRGGGVVGWLVVEEKGDAMGYGMEPNRQVSE